jgi:hypothetical protein
MIVDGLCDDLKRIWFAGVHDTAFVSDWNIVDENVHWISNGSAAKSQPFFLFEGLNIVHPPQVHFAQVHKRTVHFTNK